MTTVDTETRVRVTELLDEFFGRVDRGEPVRDLLAEQAEFRGQQGREAVTELLLSLAQKRRDNGRVSRHIVSNVSIEDQGGGKLRVRFLILVMSVDTRPDAAGELVVVDHDDEVLVDADGTCRLGRQGVTPALTFALTPQ
ncbi:hypothetical protein [Kutzneria sp. NPDC052558]|uniref:hypothetical protein n=1 Tax=Kutzneria sp. NPDC052558 TaxID=3364121 RepID=UPI0037C755DC